MITNRELRKLARSWMRESRNPDTKSLGWMAATYEQCANELLATIDNDAFCDAEDL